jgi:probable HAF family extracellular repeat protein
MVTLGDLAGGDCYSKARAVSADGTVVVGMGTSDSGSEAFLWTAGGGMVGLGDLPGGYSYPSIFAQVLRRLGHTFQPRRASG